MTNRISLSSLTTLLILAMPSLAFAQDEPTQSFVQSIFVPVLAVVFAILAAVLPLLVRKLIQVLEKKWDFEINDAIENQLDRYIHMGVAYAEEASHKALRAGQPPKSGDEKRILAVEFVTEQMERANVKTLAAESIEKLVEGALNLQRFPDPLNLVEHQAPNVDETE